MEYKPYDSYKYSGVEWIGDIPEGWEIKKLRFLGQLDSSGVDKKIRDNEELYKSVHYMDVYRNRLAQIYNCDDYLIISADKSKAIKNMLLKSDVLFTNSSETPDDIGHSATIAEDLENTLFGYHLMRFRPKTELHMCYEKYLFGSCLFRSWFEKRANGITRYGVNYIDFADAIVLLPLLSEQITIADYLDTETAKIASIISAKLKLIEKLQEKRIAIISHAVTKGLDPNAKMKPSGIDWIGDIPDGWEVVPLTKYLASLVDYRGKTPVKVDDGIFLVTARNIKNGIIDYSLSQEFVNKDDYDEIMRRGKPQIGDVLFTTEAPLGEVANVDTEGIALAQRIIKLCGHKTKVDNYFMKYWLLSSAFQGNLQSLATGSTALGIKASKLHLLRLMLPPLYQQTAITDYLDIETAKIDEIIAKTKTSIEKLNEYKTALISACVTGKIDVRGGSNVQANE